MKILSSDRLSPILVKELRQGIRSKLFIGAFLAIQILLFLYGTTLLMSDSLRGDSQAALALFWSALVLPMLLMVPAMASQGIEKEISGKTLDLLLLTRISSYRLVLGKWFSVIVQSTILVTSALPYVMLRYFLGGIDVWGELVQLGVLVLASALLAGVAMGFWATKVSRLVKWGAFLAFLWIGPTMFVVLIASRRGVSGASPGLGMTIWIYVFIAMLMMLALAASRISPPAENHSTQIRILAFAAVAAALLLTGAEDVEAASAMLAILILVPSLIGALTEKVRPIPRLYMPFVRRSGIARWLAFPFSPGWPGGVAFTLIVLTATPWFQAWRGEFRWSVFAAVVATFLFPAALVRTLLRPERRSLGPYLLFFLFLTIPIYAWGTARAFGNDPVAEVIENIVGFFPPVALALALDLPKSYPVILVTVESLLVTMWSLMALVRAAGREWRTMSSLGQVEKPPLVAVDAAAEGSVS